MNPIWLVSSTVDGLRFIQCRHLSLIGYLFMRWFYNNFLIAIRCKGNCGKQCFAKWNWDWTYMAEHIGLSKRSEHLPYGTYENILRAIYPFFGFLKGHWSKIKSKFKAINVEFEQCFKNNFCLKYKIPFFDSIRPFKKVIKRMIRDEMR